MVDRNLKISVVVPVFNGARTIGGAIERLLNQTLPAGEVIIVDDGSTDDTARIVGGFGERVICVSKRNGGPASARNLGVERATGSLVAFTDSDCLPREDWLEKLVARFDDERIAGVGGIVRSAEPNLTGEYVDLVGLLDPKADENGEISYLITANACFRKEALVRAGLFDERFRKPGGEEAELGYRLKTMGYIFRSAPDAVVFHYHRQSTMSLFRTLANYGEGASLIARLYPDRGIINPWGLFLRRVIGLRAFFNRLRSHAPRFDLKRVLYFSFMDHAGHMAFLWGYLRGRRRAA